MNLKTLWREFLDPGAAWRGKPFWAWNGKLDRPELLRQIGVMKAMGFGGFFMHSRTGLVTEYLGQEWFELINACADEAERQGLEAWLYDEDRWPSGIAGGLVTRHVGFRARSVVLDILDGAGKATTGDTRHEVARFLARVEGLDFTDCERLAIGKAPPPADPRQLLVFRVVRNTPSDFYNGNTYVDTLNPEATRLFLDLTHEQYRKHCGARLGRSIKGIFMDEPHRGRLMIRDGQDPSSAWSIPWTDRLPARFRRDFGYDLIGRLPDIFLRRDGEGVSQVKWHFVECLNRMFLDHFVRPYADWCRKHRIRVTGHVLHEDSLGAQTAMNGSLMRTYEFMDAPGVDILTRDNRCYWVVKQVASAARQLGRKWMLSELYGATGWDMSFAGHKALGDWQALFGINMRCHHLAWYTMAGEAKRDYPASMNHHSTWWDSYAGVERYFARIGLLLAQGRPACDVLVINPVESVWCQVHAGWATWLQSASPAIEPVEVAYRDLFFALSNAQIDFDYGDEEMMSRLVSVRKTARGVRLQVGKARYRVVVVPKAVTLRASTLAVLERFRASGGTVIFAGEPPLRLDALPSRRIADFAVRCCCVPAGQAGALVAAVDQALGGATVRVTGHDGLPVSGVFAQMRLTRRGVIVMLVNTDGERGLAGLRVRLMAQGQVQEWNCFDGTRRRVPARRDGGYLEFEEALPPGGEKVYVVTAGREDGIPVRGTARTVARKAWTGPFEYRLSEPNVCVLDWAQYRLGSGGWSAEMEILRADRAVREALGVPLRGGEMLQPWWVNRGKRGRATTSGRVSFRYGFEIGEMPEAPVDLVVENPCGWGIRVNGMEIPSVAGDGWWVDVAMRRLPVPLHLLRKGENRVELETEFHFGSNPEALFLLGAFGVRLHGRRRRIVRLPGTLGAGDITTQGLPFYSGKVAYALPLAGMRHRPGSRAIIRLTALGGACARVGVAGAEGLLLPWPPYEADVTEMLQGGAAALELEVVTTRRNSFGPLHEWPPSTTVVAPGNFRTDGKAFKDGYVLLPTGLLAVPELCFRS